MRLGFGGSLIPLNLKVQISISSELTKSENLTSFQHDRFGMFIHLGVYAMYATGHVVQAVRLNVEMDTPSALESK